MPANTMAELIENTHVGNSKELFVPTTDEDFMRDLENTEDLDEDLSFDDVFYKAYPSMKEKD